MYYHSHHRGLTKKETEKGTENLFEEIMAENFSNLEKETDILVQEVQSKVNL